MAVIIQTLAGLSSATATDASTFDARISALNNSIATLERSIDSLDGASTFWENFGWYCAIAVGIGVVLEIWSIVREYREDRHDWRRGIIRSPNRPSFRWMLFDVFATVIVVAGIFGEAGATGKVSSINSSLRSKTSELRAKSDQLLSIVTLEAGSAASFAERAKRAADKLQDDVRQETATRTELENEFIRNEPRATLLMDRRSYIVGKAKAYSGQHFTTLDEYWVYDWEGAQTASALTVLLELEAKWVNNTPNGSSRAPNVGSMGNGIVLIRILPSATKDTRRAALALTAILKEVLMGGVLFADKGDDVRKVIAPYPGIKFDDDTVLIEVSGHPAPLAPPHPAPATKRTTLPASK